MNIIELSEKNVSDAVALYRSSTQSYLHLIEDGVMSDAELETKLLESEQDGDFTYLFYDKGNAIAMVTVCKAQAEISNMHINFDNVDEFFADKFLEFVIKQFSAITRVFVWTVSSDSCIIDMLENYGFEYTGEQEYISKENNIFRFRYLFKRKK